MVLVVVGLLCIGGAIICGFQRYVSVYLFNKIILYLYTHRMHTANYKNIMFYFHQIFGEENDLDPEPDRAESTDSKRSLPTYDNAVRISFIRETNVFCNCILLLQLLYNLINFL